jgi:hypothetical protein
MSFFATPGGVAQARGSRVRRGRGAGPSPVFELDPTDAATARALYGARALSPEVRLRMAVLAFAIFDVRRYRPHGNAHALKLYRTARAWLESDAHTWPLDFVPVCDVLGLDPGAVRARVLGTLGDAACDLTPRWLHAVGARR